MTLRACPHCNQRLPDDSPSGICPRCVLALGLENEPSAPTATRAGPSSEVKAASRVSPADGSSPAQVSRPPRFAPPTVEEIQRCFPHLEVLELIGQGGMGAVYKARQRSLDRLVALKILPTHLARDPDFAQRFEREARTLARLSHPNIVMVYDHGMAGEFYYLMMEYVDGVSLRQAMRSRRIAPREALAIVPQVCEALQFAHDEGVVHRDIKPENVLVDHRGRVKVADFGLARLAGSGEEAITASHQVLGTPRYMAPEQMEGAQRVDHRADIYSLGVVFYELLTGELPLGRFPVPSRRSTIDNRLDQVVLRTLEKEPDLRYQRANDVKTDIESISTAPRGRRDIYGYEYRSKTELFGWPLVHIATGIDARTGRKRVARGIIAMGDIAIGGLALGGVALGGVALGGCAIGLIALGGGAIGLLLALGGGAIGTGFSVGGLAIGSVAVGGMAIGFYGLGGGVVALHGYGGNMRDPVGAQFLTQWAGALARNAPFMSLILPILVLFVLIAGWLAAVRPSDDWSDSLTRKPEPPKRPSALALLISMLVMASLAACGLMIVLAAVATVVLKRLDRATMARGAAPPGVVGTRVPGVTAEMRPDELPTWSRNADGSIAVAQEFVDVMAPSDQQRARIDEWMTKLEREYLELEARFSERSVGETGHQVTQLKVPAAEFAALEDRFWLGMDEILDERQQRIARLSLRLYPGEDSAHPGLLGWGPNRSVRVETWRQGKWFHQQVTCQGTTEQRMEPALSKLLGRFWRGGGR